MKRAKSGITKAANPRAKKAVVPEVLGPETADEELSSQQEDESDGDGDLAEPIEGLDQSVALDPSTFQPPAVADPAERGHYQDILRRYMEEVRRYPLLELAQELELANRLRENGDVEAARHLVQANLRLVVKIAMEYRSYYANLLDLIQEGNVGLMKAVSKFDPTKGARLGYYASWWIRSYILKYLLDNFRLVKIGTTQAQKKLFYHLVREKERLEAQGMLAGPKLLAEKLNVREKDVIEMEHRLSGRGAELSLDTPVDRSGDGSESSGASFLDSLTDHAESPDSALEREEMLTLLREKLPAFQKQLNDREASILTERLLSEDPKTLQELADRYRLTRERARQIEAGVIQKLRAFLALG